MSTTFTEVQDATANTIERYDFVCLAPSPAAEGVALRARMINGQTLILVEWCDEDRDVGMPDGWWPAEALSFGDRSVREEGTHPSLWPQEWPEDDPMLGRIEDDERPVRIADSEAA